MFKKHMFLNKNIILFLFLPAFQNFPNKKNFQLDSSSFPACKKYPAFQLGYNIGVEGEPRPKGAGRQGGGDMVIET
jgi:hypothetical protein